MIFIPRSRFVRCRKSGCVRHLAILLLLLSAPSLRAERQSADIDVQVGFDGAVGRVGTLFPVTVTIQNRVAGTAGTLEIAQVDSGGRSEVVDSLAFETPAPSIKRFVRHIRVEEGRDLSIQLDFRDHLRPVEKKISLSRSRKALVLCLGVPAMYRSGPPADRYQFVGIQPGLLPADPLALDGVHAVILSGRVLAALERGPLEALRRWVATGGLLIFHEPVQDEAFRGNLGLLLAQQAIHVWAPGYQPFGCGMIASTGSEPDSTKPFWEGSPAVMHLLFPATAEGKEESFQFNYRGALLTRLWQTQKAYGVWGFLSLFFIILGYIVVIGPVDRWFVGRMGKPYLTWVFFPAAIVGFSILAVGYSSLVNVGTMRLVQVNVVDAAPDAGVARGASTLWIYSARNATYKIETPAENICFSARESDLGTKSVAAVTVRNGRQSVISARIPVFSAKQFEASWYVPWAHRIQVRRDAVGGVHVTVPPELKVKSALLIEQDKVMTLSKQAGDWVGDVKTRFRSGALADAAATLKRCAGSFYAGGFGGSGDAGRLMPTPDILQAYVLYLSFPGPWASKAESTDNGSLTLSPDESMDERRDSWEKTLDIRSRLFAGRTLLLFLEPDGNVLPVRVGLMKPSTAQMTLVRLRIPDDEKAPRQGIPVAAPASGGG